MQAVVITGLAQGIGREVATLLARSKVPVAGFDVDKEGIESLKEEFAKAGCDHLLTTVDMAQAKESVRRMAALDFDIACFGHGGVMRKDAVLRFRRFAEKVR